VNRAFNLDQKTSNVRQEIDLGNWKRAFFPIWVGQAFSLLGSQLVQFSLVWWLTAKTGSATVLATATLLALLPSIVLGPLAGAYVDRWDRRLVMIVADGVVAVATATLIVLNQLGAMHPWQVYVIMFIRSLGGTFHWPAMQASTSLMVPKEHLSRVAGLNQVLQGAMNIMAPPLGGLLIATLPMSGGLGGDVATAALGILPLAFATIPQPVRRPNNGANGHIGSIVEDLHEALRYLRTWPGLLAVGVMAVLFNMAFQPAISLLPILVSKHFGRGALELGWMESAFGVGVVAGGLTLSVWGGFRRRVLTALSGLIGLGVASVVIGFMPQAAFMPAVTVTFVAGFMLPMASGPLFASVQAIVAPELQGRVFNLMGSGAQAAAPLGLLIAGPIADLFGANTWFIIGGLICTLMAATSLFVPQIMHLEDHEAIREALGHEREPEPEPETTPGQ